MPTSIPRSEDSLVTKSTKPHVDQASRIIGKYYQQDDGDLIVGGVQVSSLVEKFGSPLFVYDRGIIDRKIGDVRSTLTKRFDLFYSVKANPSAAILKYFLQHKCGLEIASAGELYQALAAGCPPDRIIFAGPGKTHTDLLAAVDASIREIHVESIEEARSINRLAQDRRKISNVALRVNPIDKSGGAMRMGGQSSPFGIDEENLDHAIDAMLDCKHLKITGLHLFMGTQILDAETLIGQYRNAVSIANRVASRTGPLGSIDFGGGWGTPYFPHELELDLDIVRNGIAEIDILMAADPMLENTRAIIEPGRFLINEAGIYLSKVTRVKESRGKKFAIIDGGMHHHLAASGNLGQAIKRNFPMIVANKLDQSASEKTEVVGLLCTPLDTLGRSIEFPVVEAGDLIGVLLSGAYARTASPLGFLSHKTPAEVFIGEGKAILIRRRGDARDTLRDQIDV